MRVLELKDATGTLSDYALEARKGEPLLVTLRGKPLVTLQSVARHTDFENLAVTTSPKFQAIMARSQARYEAEGGLTTEEVRGRLALRRKAATKKPR